MKGIYGVFLKIVPVNSKISKQYKEIQKNKAKMTRNHKPRNNGNVFVSILLDIFLNISHV